MAWGQYRTSDFAAISAQGKCVLNLKDLDAQMCPDSKRDSTTNPNRQKDCSPHIQEKCFDVQTGAYANKNCPVGSHCARWVQVNGGAKFYADGCILPQYCGTRGNYGGSVGVAFDCPDATPNTGTPTTPTGPSTPVDTGRQGTRCTATQENDTSNLLRVNQCSSFDYCTSQATGLGDNSLCTRPNEYCGKYAWKSSSGTTLANLDACILKKYCGLTNVKNPSWNADGTSYEYTTSYSCAGVTTTPVAPVVCQNGQVLNGGVCQCPAGQSLVGGYCQTSAPATTCLPGQTQAYDGTCTCPVG